MENEYDSAFKNLADPHSKILYILKEASRAPSTHNSQPWKIKILDQSCEIYPDYSRELPYADKTGRDLFISLGCFVENIVLISSYFNVLDSVKIEGEGSDVHFDIFFDLSNVPETSSVYTPYIESIKNWVNARGLFEPLVLHSSDIENILKEGEPIDERLSVSVFTHKKEREIIAQKTSDGLCAAHANPHFRKEMSSWMNHSLSRKRTGIPGYALNMPLVASFIVPLIIRHKDLSGAFAKLNHESIMSSSAIFLISAVSNSPGIWLAVGRLSQRLMLICKKNGLQTSIFVAAIEMGGLSKDVQALQDDRSFLPQFLFVVGEMKKIHKQTPRENIHDKIIL